jgi:hypothetical protein
MVNTIVGLRAIVAGFYLTLVLVPGLVACKQAQETPAGEAQIVGNAVCPVSGKPVGGSATAPNFHSDFSGWRVGFMCPVCKGKFDSAPAAKKLELLNKALQSVGKPIIEEKK